MGYIGKLWICLFISYLYKCFTCTFWTSFPLLYKLNLNSFHTKSVSLAS